MTSSKSNLNGRVVFITGAASGIGAATALEVVAMGVRPSWLIVMQSLWLK